MLFETERGMVKAVGERDLPPRAARRSRRGQTSECGCGRRSDRGCFESPVAPPGVSAQAARSHRDRQPLAERRQIRSERRYRPTEPPTSRDNRSEGRKVCAQRVCLGAARSAAPAAGRGRSTSEYCYCKAPHSPSKNNTGGAVSTEKSDAEPLSSVMFMVRGYGQDW